MSDIVQVPLTDILLDQRLQMRKKMDPLVIEEYAENLADLPPAKIVRGPNGELWLTWGWHRYHAHQKENQNTMPCTVHDGTWADAIAEAAGGNYEHGVRRTIEDKRRAIAAILTLDEWKDKSNNMIAEACHVSDKLVAKIRERAPTSESRSSGASPNQPPGKRIGKDGKPRPATNRNQPPEESTNGKAPKPGKAKFNEKKFDAAFGALTRVVDERGNAMGKGPHHKRCQDILGDFIKEYALWKKESA